MTAQGESTGEEKDELEGWKKGAAKHARVIPTPASVARPPVLLLVRRSPPSNDNRRRAKLLILCLPRRYLILSLISPNISMFGIGHFRTDSCTSTALHYISLSLFCKVVLIAAFRLVDSSFGSPKRLHPNMNGNPRLNGSLPHVPPVAML